MTTKKQDTLRTGIREGTISGRLRLGHSRGNVASVGL